MTALVHGVVRSADAGWRDPLTVAALGAGVLLLVLFVLDESRAEQPIIPLRLLASRERAGAYAGRILFLGAMMGFWFFITQFLQVVYGYSPLEAGGAFLPMTVANFAVAVATPRLTRRFGNPRSPPRSPPAPCCSPSHWPSSSCSSSGPARPRTSRTAPCPPETTTSHRAAAASCSTAPGGDDSGDPDQEAEHEGPGGDVHR
jgi:hypothetical protein